MKKGYSVSGLRVLSKRGGLIFCDNYGVVEISRQGNSSDPEQRVQKMADDKNGIAVCKCCGTQMFGIIANRVKTYSFYVECVCGEKYDVKSNAPRRLGETAQMLNNKNRYKKYGV